MCLLGCRAVGDHPAGVGFFAVLLCRPGRLTAPTMCTTVHAQLLSCHRQQKKKALARSRYINVWSVKKKMTDEDTNLSATLSHVRNRTTETRNNGKTPELPDTDKNAPNISHGQKSEEFRGRLSSMQVRLLCVTLALDPRTDCEFHEMRTFHGSAGCKPMHTPSENTTTSTGSSTQEELANTKDSRPRTEGLRSILT